MSEYIDSVRLNGVSIPIRDSGAREQIAQISRIAGGNGIAGAVLNPDFTLTLTFTDGTAYTTPSLRGTPGVGIPAGGSVGQVLQKRSASDNDVEWDSPLKAVAVDFGTVSSLPLTKTVPGVTADMAVVAHAFGTPEAIIGDLTVTAVDGAITLSGSINGSTTVKLILVSPEEAAAS